MDAGRKLKTINMQTPLPAAISSYEEAKAFLKSLYDHGEAFHPDDSPHTVIVGVGGGFLFTKDEADAVDKLMDQVWRYFDERFPNDADHCPSGYYLSIDPEYHGSIETDY